jgi:hypothetical protein
VLDTCNPTDRARFHNDFLAVQRGVSGGLSASRANATRTAWDIWSTFCQQINTDPFLQHLEDPIPTLQLFAQGYRTGTLAPRGTTVGARTVEGALRAVGQTLAALGHRDPRLTQTGNMDIRLQRLLTSYEKEDPAPQRQKPIPLDVILQAASVAIMDQSNRAQALSDMLLIAFYFLLRPGEYAHSTNVDAAPFRIKHVHFITPTRRLHWASATANEWAQVNKVALEFDRQKNGVRGELVGLAPSGHERWCPVKTLIRRVQALHQQGADQNTPLYAYRNAHHQWAAVTPSDLTEHLRAAAIALNHVDASQSHQLSARSLRSSGAMALLCAGVDPTLIQLFGRWKSTEMLRYLHVQSVPVAAAFAPAMLNHGNFSMIPQNPTTPQNPNEG